MSKGGPFDLARSQGRVGVQRVRGERKGVEKMRWGHFAVAKSGMVTFVVGRGSIGCQWRQALLSSSVFWMVVAMHKKRLLRNVASWGDRAVSMPTVMAGASVPDYDKT